MPLAHALVELETFENDLIADRVIFDAIWGHFFNLFYLLFPILKDGSMSIYQVLLMIFSDHRFQPALLVMKN